MRPLTLQDKRNAIKAWRLANEGLLIHKREPMLDRLPYVAMPLPAAIGALRVQADAARALAKLCGVSTP